MRRTSEIFRISLKILISGSVLAVFFCGMCAHATTFVRMDLRALARSAEIIARVRCTDSQIRRERGEIWTFDDLAVLETFKGAPANTLQIRLPGGSIGHVTTRIDGVPQFTINEEAVLFIEKNSAGDYSITSWAQGTFRVRRDAAGGNPVITQDTNRAAVFDPATHEFTNSGARDLPLGEFRRQIADALRQSSSTTSSMRGVSR
jgi:hypothetical protein